MNIKLRDAYEIGMYFERKKLGIPEHIIEDAILVLRSIRAIEKKN